MSKTRENDFQFVKTTTNDSKAAAASKNDEDELIIIGPPAKSSDLPSGDTLPGDSQKPRAQTSPSKKNQARADDPLDDLKQPMPVAQRVVIFLATLALLVFTAYLVKYWI
jgi:hypothetical protein